MSDTTYNAVAFSKPLKTSQELQAEGQRLRKLRKPVPFVHPSQEWQYVRWQLPFILGRRLDNLKK